MLRKPLGGLVAVLILAAAAACSTGQTNVAPLTAGASNAVSTIGNAPYQTNAVNGMTSYVAVSGTGSVTASASATAPTGTVALSAATRALIAHQADSTGNTPLLYYTLTATATTTITAVSYVNITMPSAPTGSTYLAYWTGTQWETVNLPTPKPGTYANGTLGIPGGALNGKTGVALNAGQSLYLAAYVGSLVTPVPSPTPQPSAPVASPSALALSIGQQGTVSVTSGIEITITAQSSNTSVATVTASASTGTGTSASFTVKAVAAGTATITFTDPLNRTTTSTMTVSAAPPSPDASPAVIGLGDIASVNLSAKPSTLVTITSNSPSTAKVSTSSSGAGAGNSVQVTTDGNGAATFYVVAEAGGATTITMVDALNDTGTMNVTVSAITNGTFASGVTGWTACSFAHTAFNAPVNPSTPTPNTPVPAQTTAPTASVASVASLIGATSPPANDSPNAPGATAPPVLGTSVALVGSIDSQTPAPGGSTNQGAFPKGEFGMCQVITVPASAAYLSFWVWEGGSNYSFATSDQEADILDSTGTTIQSTLFAEQNCYIHPSSGWAPGAATSSGCWPATYGGDTSNYQDWIGGGYWQPRGPYNLSSYAGTQVTLYIGNWSYYTDSASKYAAFLYVGTVQMTGSSTFPTTAPARANRSLGTVTLTNRSIQSNKNIR